MVEVDGSIEGEIQLGFPLSSLNEIDQESAFHINRK